MNREQIKELFEQKQFLETLEYFFAEMVLSKAGEVLETGGVKWQGQ